MFVLILIHQRNPYLFQTRQVIEVPALQPLQILTAVNAVAEIQVGVVGMLFYRPSLLPWLLWTDSIFIKIQSRKWDITRRVVSSKTDPVAGISNFLSCMFPSRRAQALNSVELLSMFQFRVRFVLFGYPSHFLLVVVGYADLCNSTFLSSSDSNLGRFFTLSMQIDSKPFFFLPASFGCTDWVNIWTIESVIFQSISVSKNVYVYVTNFELELQWKYRRSRIQVPLYDTCITPPIQYLLADIVEKNPSRIPESLPSCQVIAQ